MPRHCWLGVVVVGAEGPDEGAPLDGEDGRDGELDDELDGGRISGIGVVGITPVAYAAAQASTFCAYAREWLYRMTAATLLLSAMMSDTPAHR